MGRPDSAGADTARGGGYKPFSVNFVSVIGTATALTLAYLGVTATGAAVAFALAVAAWRRRDQPAAPQFALLNLDVAGWCVTEVLLRLDVPAETFVWQVNNVFVFALIFVWFAFVLAYTGRSAWLWSKPALALWSVPSVVAVVAFVPPARRLLVDPAAPMTVSPATFTDLGLALLVFVFSVDALAFGLLGLFLLRSRSPYRKQVGAVLGARLFAFATALVFYAGLLGDLELNPVPAAFAVQSVVVGWALFRYDLLDVAPLAADAIVEQMDDSVVVLDTDDRIVDYNPSMATLVGGDAELTGRPAESVLPGLVEAVDAGGTVELTPASPDRDGRRTRIYEPQSTPLYDHHDLYRGQVVVLRDVTLQRTRERTLEGLQSATEAFLDATDAGTVAEIAVETAESALSCPYSGVVLYGERANDAEYAALADELVRALRDAGFPTDDLDDLPPDRDGHLSRVYESGEELVGEPLVLERDGVTFSAPSTHLLPLGEHGVLGLGTADDAGFRPEERRTARTLARATETALDRITREAERDASREALEQRTEQLQFFNSALRHDLRNAVMVIDANLELLSEHVTESGRSHLETVSKWVEDVGGLVETVGSITDAVTDAEDHGLSAVDVSAVLEDRIAKVEAGHGSLAVERSLPEGLLVTADDLLGEVVENLLLNAVEHNDSDDPHVTVTAEKRGDTVEIRIADDGPGIPEKFRGEVFDPGVTSDDGGSIGFGLYFVKVMAEEYGGSVHFEENEPRGTVAVLVLPAASGADPE